jgi:hypothetical protein
MRDFVPNQKNTRVERANVSTFAHSNAPFAPKSVEGAVEFWRGPDSRCRDIEVKFIIVWTVDGETTSGSFCEFRTRRVVVATSWHFKFRTFTAITLTSVLIQALG